jgi:hypothetical protein
MQYGGATTTGLERKSTIDLAMVQGPNEGGQMRKPDGGQLKTRGA